MKVSALVVVRWIWVAMSVLVLAVTLALFDGQPNSDAEVLLAYGMLTLSFPSSFAVALLASAVGRIAYSVVGYVATVSYASLAITWLLFFIAGYLQWFVFVPWLWKKIRSSRSQTGNPSIGA